jgi:pantoate--beta-alanine ligase
VVVSIFVNPTQFGPSEDFARYPRTLDDDVAALAGLGVELVFAPSAEEVYGQGFATWVEPGGVAEPLEGEHRPGHFRGVATVVLKLLNMVTPEVAYFGQKDYQQVAVIRQMVEQLNVPVDVRTCPTVREPDGLAMSSRNRYLSADARRRALGLVASLRRAEAMVAAGTRDTAPIRQAMEQTIRDAEPVDVPIEIDYVAIRDPRSLGPIERIDPSAVALLAVRVAGTRLIDNTLLRRSADSSVPSPSGSGSG